MLISLLLAKDNVKAVFVLPSSCWCIIQRAELFFFFFFSKEKMENEVPQLKKKKKERRGKRRAEYYRNL